MLIILDDGTEFEWDDAVEICNDLMEDLNAGWDEFIPED